MSLLVTGGTGFVGRRLLAQLDNAITCSRNPANAEKSIGNLASIIKWNPVEGPINVLGQPRLNAVVNLMGEPIAERWDESKKKRIYESRVVGTNHLVDGLLSLNQLPDVLVSASAVGIYADCGEAEVTEQHAHGKTTNSGVGYLVKVSEDWEAAANRLSNHGVRVVNLRIGIVLGGDGGALEKMIPLFRWGLGGRLGSGQQWVPWIHVDDLVKMILFCIEHDSIRGPVNATAPQPVRNLELTQRLAKQLHRPAILPVPSFAIRLAMGEFGESLFSSQKVIPQAALDSGYQFQFPDLSSALKDIVP